MCTLEPPEQHNYVDDLTISNSDAVWRRIPPHHIFFDENLGRYRPSSAAFEDHPNGSPMSAQLKSVLENLGIDSKQAIASYLDFGLIEIPVSFLRESCNLGICFREALDQPGHVEIFGKKTKSLKNKLARESRWLENPRDEGSIKFPKC